MVSQSYSITVNNVIVNHLFMFNFVVEDYVLLIIIICDCKLNIIVMLYNERAHSFQFSYSVLGQAAIIMILSIEVISNINLQTMATQAAMCQILTASVMMVIVVAKSVSS